MNMQSLTKRKSIFKGVFPIFLGFLALVTIACILSSSFYQMTNIMNVLRQISNNCIIAVGMTFVILTGGIDLAVGSIVALTAVIVASVQSTGPVASVLIGLSVGTICGIISGLIIVFRKLQPFIVTLAMMTITRGLAFIYSGGQPILGVSDGFAAIAKSYLGPIPFPAIYMVIIVAIAYFLLRFTYFGRSFYAIGGNEEAAILSGTRVGLYKTVAYAISGFLASLSAILVVSRVTVGEPIVGQGWELDAIAAVVIGGTSMSGGVGSVLGTLIGALILGVLSNVFNLLDVSAYAQNVVKGIIILAAVFTTTKKNKD